MRIPNRILEHPVESLVAVTLLLALLFGSSDFVQSGKASSTPAPHGTQLTEKM